MARVKGNTLPVLSFKTAGAGVLKDLGADVVSVGLEDGDGEAVTMADAATGVRPAAMNVTFVLDWAATSAYEYLYVNAGAALVAFVLQPDSGTVSQTKPKFVGTCTLPNRPYFTIEKGTEAITFEVTIQLDDWNKSITV